MQHECKEAQNITVAIPTYNRLGKLKKQIERLLPQLSKDDVVIVIDNASSSYSLDELHYFQKDKRIFIHRNKNNIGANANILRCFEKVDTEWMWLLSDDDIIFDNSLDLIKEEIKTNKVDFINFSSELLSTSREDVVCKTLDEYLDAINSGISNHLLISNNVYRVSSFLPYLSFSYWGVYVNAPHLAPVFVALQNGKEILLSSQSIVHWEHNSSDDSWQFANLYNLLYLPDVISDSKLRKKAIRLIIKSLPAPEKLTAQLSFYKILQEESHDRIDAYSRRVLQIYMECGNAFLKIRACLLSYAIQIPHIYLWLLDFAFKRAKNKSIYNYLQKGKFNFYI
ncbi:glycosyltransferase family 2 protein [Aeromonas hydrophila]|uniref:glycosyltransferase family 2 protein n=1 Tax=Aeromonas hydrophila TaxID=644 RepID=UPI0009B90680|nr:glycosyltransferase family 2 protein [Aeromonas hydrophila]